MTHFVQSWLLDGSNHNVFLDSCTIFFPIANIALLKIEVYKLSEFSSSINRRHRQHSLSVCLCLCLCLCVGGGVSTLSALQIKDDAISCVKRVYLHPSGKSRGDDASFSLLLLWKVAGSGALVALGNSPCPPVPEEHSTNAACALAPLQASCGSWGRQD